MKCLLSKTIVSIKKKKFFLKFIIELYSLLNARSRLMSVRICFNTYHNSRQKAYIFVLGAWETDKQKDWNKFYFPISAVPEWGNVISRDNNTFKWLGIYLIPKSYGKIDSISNSSSQGGCGCSIDRSDFSSNEEGSVIKFPEAHPACHGHLLDIVTLLWHRRDSLFPEAGSIGLGDLCSKVACGSLLSRSCALEQLWLASCTVPWY